MNTHPHQGQPILTAGARLEEARAAAILIHGRGASARDIMGFSRELERSGLAFLAPNAAGNSWWPYRFIEPIEANEPYITSALRTIADLVTSINSAGIPAEKILVLGFSQGAVLAAEFAARHAQRYGGIAVLTGGLVGPQGTARAYTGNLAGTPVFIGSSDIDPHIPLWRVEETAAVLTTLGANVTTRIYPNMGHFVNDDELAFVQQMVDTLMAS